MKTLQIEILHNLHVMDCDDFVMKTDDSVNDELQVGSLSYEKMTRSLQKEGFRKGSAAGHDKAFQDGFDLGYKVGFEAGFMLGSYNGVLRVLENSTHGIPQEEDGSKAETFKSPTTGECLLCSSRYTNTKNVLDENVEVMANKKTEQLSEIIARQKEIIETEVQSKLKLKYTELLGSLNIPV